MRLVLVVGIATGCMSSRIVGPLSHQRTQRSELARRATAVGTSPEQFDKIFPPPTVEEDRLARDEDASCLSSYRWKNGFTWTGSALVGAAAGLTIGAA